MTLVTERFVSLATSIMRARGVPNLTLLVLPADVEARSPADLRALAEKLLPDVRDRLSAPAKPPITS
ncbi:MAG: hypothetical protein AAB369_03645 [Chloroflexota bacterium]